MFIIKYLLDPEVTYRLQHTCSFMDEISQWYFHCAQHHILWLMSEHCCNK